MNLDSEPSDNPGLVQTLRLELQKCERLRADAMQRVEYLEGAFSHIADAIFIVELDGRIAEVNPAASVLLGYSREELLAMRPWDFVTSASREYILDQLRDLPFGTPVVAHRTYRRKDGEQNFVEVRMARCNLAGRELVLVSSRDVTEQKRLENRLRRSERNLAEGQRLTKTGSWILDFKTGNTDWSVETCRIFGFPDPPPSPHYREFRARVRPEDRESVDRGLRESFESVEPRPLKYIYVLPDGTRKNIETISEPVRNESGELRLMGTVMDVTERVKSQVALQLSEDHLRLVIDTIPGLVWSSKPDGFIEYLNKRWLDYTGLTLDQARGWGWRQAIHPEDLPGLEAYWRSILAEGKAGATEARLRRFDGEFRWFLFRGVPLNDASGRPVQWYGTNADIDDLKQAEQRLRRSEAHLTEAQCLSRTGSFSWTPASGDVAWSAQMFRIFGFDPSATPSLELARQRTHPDDIALFQEKVRRGLQEGADLEYEHRLLMPGGKIKHLHVVARASRDKFGRVEYAGAVMDTTERTRAADALRASEHLARGQLNSLTMTLDSLSQESDPDKIPKHIVNTIVSQMGAHSATIWERGDERLDLLGIVEEGHFSTRREAGYFAGSIPVSGHAPPLWVEGLAARTHLVIEDINKEPSRIILADGRTANWTESDLTTPFAELKRHLAAQGVRGLLIAPMLLGGDLAGIIGIRFTGTRVFGPEEIELTKALARQATLAIELTRLSKQSREAAVIAERNRMARDIHDTLAQGFTGVIMQLEAARGATTQGHLPEALVRIKRASELARSSLGEARRSVRALRPRSLRDGSLFLALDGLLKRMTDGTDLSAEFQAEGDGGSVPADCEEDLLRITQEALTNALKHANARNFRATLKVEGKKIELRLVDDGRGFDPQAEYEGFGLIGLKERVDRMGGRFILRAKPEVGTEILVELGDQPQSQREATDEQA